jgi:stalled ribosome rescue protein Dom34
MEIKKNIGIWMDHSNANLIDLQTGKSDHTIVSEFDFETKEEALQRSENIMHNKRQQMNEAFYKEIGSELVNYKHVLLFGPTDAKTELNNYLKKDSKFKDIQIEVESADKMTDNEKVAFVKNHFKK